MYIMQPFLKYVNVPHKTHIRMQCHLQTYGTCKPDKVAIALCFLKIGGVSVNHGGGPQNDTDVL